MKRQFSEFDKIHNSQIRYTDRLRSHHKARAPLRSLRFKQLDFAAQLQSISDSENLNFEYKTERRAIYIHVPFCTRRCTFCNLRRIQRKPHDDYHKLLIKEMKRYSTYKYINEGEYDAIYFGGGTPTTLSANKLKSILQALKLHFNITPQAEITFETTVSDLTEERIDVFYNENVNRISIGVQTFNDKGRKILGRKGTGDKAVEKIEQLLDKDFDNVNIDLIYNYPDQTIEDLKQDLSTITSLNLAGLSVYSLILQKEAVLYRQIETNRISPLGEIDQEYEFYNVIFDYLRNSGFELLELTKLVRPNRDNYEYIRIRHNNGDTLGLGAGAGSRLGNLSYSNPLDIEEYRQQVNGSTRLPDQYYELKNPYNFMYSIFGKLQYSKINWSDLAPYDKNKHLRKLITELEEEGLVVSNTQGFSLTKKGIFWGNNISQELAIVLLDFLKNN